jgi:hypothetical protein
VRLGEIVSRYVSGFKSFGIRSTDGGKPVVVVVDIAVVDNDDNDDDEVDVGVDGDVRSTLVRF